MVRKLMILIFGILLIFSGYIRIAQTNNYQFPLTYDQSRDLLDIRVPGTFKDIPIIGPTTSINGLRLGPGYYYFNLPAFWVGGGDPQVLIYWNILWFLIAGAVIFWFFYNRDLLLGMCISLTYLFAPMLFDTTRYFWNAHSMVYVMVFYFLSLIYFVNKKSTKSVIILAITSGVSMHFEAAMGVVAVSFALITSIILVRKKVLIFVAALIPWFAPQIAVEVFRGFGMTKLLLMEMKNPQMLGDKLSLLATLVSHLKVMGSYLEGQFILPFGFGRIVLLIAIILGLAVKKIRRLTVLFVLFGLYCLLFYWIFYRHELKIWYGLSLRVWYVFLVGYGVTSLIEIGERVRMLIFIVMAIVLARNIITTYIDQVKFVNNSTFAKDDPKLASHELRVVDWAFGVANGDGFKVYSYVPEIYDYPYQYLFWWRGKTKFGYTPEEILYEPLAPPYVPRQEQFYTMAKKSDGLIILVYERKSKYKEWLGKFSNLCMIEKNDFEWQVSIEARKSCN